jgi:hypothetical protein
MKRLLWLWVGLALGVGLGFLIGWGISPMPDYDSGPAALRADYRDEYIRLVALAYQVEGDLAQARQRLAALGTEDSLAPLVELTERMIQEGRSERLIAPPAKLAHDLGADTPAMAPYLR